jgi:hypothetical protein
MAKVSVQILSNPMASKINPSSLGNLDRRSGLINLLHGRRGLIDIGDDGCGG